jgi:hypothetical protein
VDIAFLRLKLLRPLRLGDNLLAPGFKGLDSITKSLPPPGAIPPDRLDAVRNRLRSGFLRKLPFVQYTNFPRRETTLLHLYCNDLHEDEKRKLLPPFDEIVGLSLLGGKKSKVKLDQATRLFLTHFGEERIPCLSWLANWLRVSWKKEYLEKQTGEISPYITEAETLFNVDAPQKVAQKRLKNETVEELALRLKIPDDSEFKKRLFNEIVLFRLKTTSQNSVEPDLQQLIVHSKEKKLGTGYDLGAEAVKIFIRRTINECGGKVPPSWRDLLVSFACDPRTLDRVALSRWWGWATNQEKQVACNALIQWGLDEFLDQLSKSLLDDREQFEHRKDILRSIVYTGRAIDFRLVVSVDVFCALGDKIKKSLSPKIVKGDKNTISFICLKCIDDVFLIEGSSKFALRGFIGEKKFPISNLWNNSDTEFSKSIFITPEKKCNIYVKHLGDPKKWKWNFIQQLRSNNIEWRNLYSS